MDIDCTYCCGKTKRDDKLKIQVLKVICLHIYEGSTDHLEKLFINISAYVWWGLLLRSLCLYFSLPSLPFPSTGKLHGSTLFCIPVYLWANNNLSVAQITIFRVNEINFRKCVWIGVQRWNFTDCFTVFNLNKQCFCVSSSIELNRHSFWFNLDSALIEVVFFLH